MNEAHLSDAAYAPLKEKGEAAFGAAYAREVAIKEKGEQTRWRSQMRLAALQSAERMSHNGDPAVLVQIAMTIEAYLIGKEQG